MDFSDVDTDSIYTCLNDEEQQKLAEYLQRIIDELESRSDSDFGHGRHGYGHDRGEYGHHGDRFW